MTVSVILDNYMTLSCNENNKYGNIKINGEYSPMLHECNENSIIQCIFIILSNVR